MQTPRQMLQSSACGVDAACITDSRHGLNSRVGAAVVNPHAVGVAFALPAMGSWISYGLGTENRILPGFITICPALTHGGVNNYASAFLPAVYHGTPIGNAATSSERATIPFIAGPTPAGIQRMELDFLAEMNRERLEQTGPDAALESRIASFELAFRMQAAAPELQDIRNETPETLRLYGLGQERTRNFGRQCLM